MKKMKRNYTILLILAVIFALPGLAAYEFYAHPQWMRQVKVNKGELLNPPELLANVNAKPKWRLIFWSPGNCETECLAQVEKLARVRLALGRRLYQVDELLVINNPARTIPKNVMKAFLDKDIQVLRLSDEQRSKQPALTATAKIFIANPEDYLILAYDITTKPGDIFHDIGQLLSVAEKKNG